MPPREEDEEEESPSRGISKEIPRQEELREDMLKWQQWLRLLLQNCCTSWRLYRLSAKDMVSLRQISAPPGEGSGTQGRDGGVGPTFQSDGLWAVDVQQGGQSTAVRVVLQQVLHQGERRRAPLLGRIPPVESLKPWQQHKDTTSSLCEGSAEEYLLMQVMTLSTLTISTVYAIIRVSMSARNQQLIRTQESGLLLVLDDCQAKQSVPKGSVGEAEEKSETNMEVKLDKDTQLLCTLLMDRSGTVRQLDTWIRQLDTWIRQLDTWIRQLDTWSQQLDTWSQQLDTWIQQLDTWSQQLDTWIQELDTWIQQLDTWIQELDTWIRQLDTCSLTLKHTTIQPVTSTFYRQ
ncbi:hypothetical protein EYF80_021965 [Liparis tanakae]|uniref:Uncharacterized protein n=1 Tax=Liparis tanakae TaxID=230148 RepID=A0A4Z2HQF3_9TELE|nr:hypothetical protein EYF80_021965 [Liparis tanakae]